MFEFDGILLKPCLLQPSFHVAGRRAARGPRGQSPWAVGSATWFATFEETMC